MKTKLFNMENETAVWEGIVVTWLVSVVMSWIVLSKSHGFDGDSDWLLSAVVNLHWRISLSDWRKRFFLGTALWRNLQLKIVPMTDTKWSKTLKDGERQKSLFFIQRLQESSVKFVYYRLL